MAVLGDGDRITETTTAATGDYRDRVLSRMAERADQISYWKAVRAEQIAAGLTGDYSAETIAKGDLVRVSGRWRRVVRVNAKSVAVEQPATFGDRLIRGTVPYQDLGGHRRAT